MSQRTPVNIALVGLGNHGRTIQQSAVDTPDVKVVAVFDPNDEEASAAALRFDCPQMASYEEILAMEHVEAVVLTTPNRLHRAQVEAAAAAGKHVLVEKPIANTMEDGHAMRHVMESAGRKLMVGHNMRRNPAIRRAHALIREGRIGTPVSTEIHYSAPGGLFLAEGAWRLSPTECPLLPVMQLAIHGIDQVQALYGNFAEVHAYSRAVVVKGGAVDQVSAVWRTHDGHHGTLTSNYCSSVQFTTRFTGTDGTLFTTPHRFSLTRREDTDGKGEGPAYKEDYRDQDGHSFQEQMQVFADHIRLDTPSETDAKTGLSALAVVEALFKSTQSGKPETVEVVE